MSHRETSSDPLPFIQLDRSAKGKAIMLAGALGVSVQHMVGSLVTFWEINSDPRELEQLIEDGQDALVLPGDEVKARFHMASGHEVSPDLLARAGFLESVEGGFRVRGMSRYFRTINRRVQSRTAASLGGKATAAKLKRVNGKFTAEKPAGGPLERPVQRKPADEPSDAPSENQPTNQPSDQAATKRGPSLESRGQRLDTFKKPTADKPPKALKKPPEPSRPGWQALIDAMTIEFQNVRGESYDWHHGASRGQLKALRERHSDEDILRRWSRGLRGTYDRKVSAVEQLGNAAKWHALATDEERKPSDSAIADHTGFAPRWEGVYTEELPPYDPLNPLGEVPS